MITVDLRALVGKLNDACRRALEGAAGLCLSKTHYEVEIEHYLLKLLEQSDGDVAALLRHYEVNHARVTQELMRALDRLKTGNSRAPALSPRLPRLLLLAEPGHGRLTLPHTSRKMKGRNTSRFSSSLVASR